MKEEGPPGKALFGYAALRPQRDPTWPLPCENKHGRRLTSDNAAMVPPTLAFAVVACRLVPAGLQGVRRLFAACWLG
jgi:hypothetical protein